MDPYGHGETCTCSWCTSYSEGYEAGLAAARAPVRVPNLLHVTSVLDREWRGLRETLPPSGGAFVMGLLVGHQGEEAATKHLQALDSVCRLHNGAPGTTVRRNRVVEFLQVAGVVVRDQGHLWTAPKTSRP